MMNKGYGNFVCGFLAGAAIGAVGTLLAAPKPGRELRREIRDSGKKLRDKVNGRYVDVRERGRKAMVKTRETLRGTSEGMKDAARALTGA
jgi:gas vesicle protein